MDTATINWMDGHVRFYPDGRLGDEAYQAVRKAGFSWKRGQQCFEAIWRPSVEDFLAEQFDIEQLDDDETDILAEAESRADHFAGWSGSAARRANDAHRTAGDIAKRFAFGQPILIGHHSEKRARRDKDRIAANMDKAVHERDRADYWASRAKRAVAAAERKLRPDVIYRRIEGIEKELRWARDGNYERWIEFLEKRLAYQQALYAESGGIVSDHVEFEVGGAVLCWAGLCEILRVNKKSVSVNRHIRDDIYWKEVITYDKVKRVFSKAEYQAAKEKHEADS